MRLALLAILCACSALRGQGPEHVVVIANANSPVSKAIAEYYARRRGVPARNVCYLNATTDEWIARDVYEREIGSPVAAFLNSRKLREQALYLVTTLGVPLAIRGAGEKLNSEEASVDSELTLLYQAMQGVRVSAAGMYPNPFFGKLDRPFRRESFPIYLVTRLGGYDFADVRGLIDRALSAVNRGKVILDARSGGNPSGNEWLRAAAQRLPPDRVELETTEQVVYRRHQVIGYASWGSNDPARKQRTVGFQWLPGAIMTEYVSTNGRTFERPPQEWTLSSWNEKDRAKWFKGSPQTLTADYVHEGVTGASGHVGEPYLAFTPRPDYLFPAYLSGRTLAESYYLAIPALSWKNIVVGDPLCRLGRTRRSS